MVGSAFYLSFHLAVKVSRVEKKGREREGGWKPGRTARGNWAGREGGRKVGKEWEGRGCVAVKEIARWKVQRCERGSWWEGRCG